MLGYLQCVNEHQIEFLQFCYTPGINRFAGFSLEESGDVIQSFKILDK